MRESEIRSKEETLACALRFKNLEQDPQYRKNARELRIVSLNLARAEIRNSSDVPALKKRYKQLCEEHEKILRNFHII